MHRNEVMCVEALRPESIMWWGLESKSERISVTLQYIKDVYKLLLFPLKGSI